MTIKGFQRIGICEYQDVEKVVALGDFVGNYCIGHEKDKQSPNNLEPGTSPIMSC